MSQELSRGQMEAAREELLNKLSFARQRHNQIKLAAALGQVDDQTLAEAEQSVRGIEQKLDGLRFGLEQVSAEEREQQEVQKLARRREVAFELYSLIVRRGAAVAALDDAFHAVNLTVEKIEELTNEIKFAAQGWLPDGDGLGGRSYELFLSHLGARGLGDILNDVPTSRRRYAPGLGATRQLALNVAAKGLPDILDEGLQAEAREHAKAIIAAEGDKHEADVPDPEERGLDKAA